MDTPESDDNDIQYFKNLHTIKTEMDTNQDGSISFNEFTHWIKYNFVEKLILPAIFFAFLVIAWSAISDNYNLFKVMVLSKNKMDHITFNTAVFIIFAFAISFGPGFS